VNTKEATNQTSRDDRKITSLALTKADHARLKEIAAVQHRTVSAQVRYWISRDRSKRAA
jgi:hypothetical protein